MSVYVAVAYRWGWSNGSHYYVGGWTDQDKAEQAAADEAEDRGGKYGVTVYAMDADGATAVSHAPSAYGEPWAKFNPRLYVLEQIGCWVANLADGCVDGELTVEAIRKQETFHAEVAQIIAEAQAKSRREATA